MLRLSSLSEARATLIADASVTINLCASGAGDAILAALPFRVGMAGGNGRGHRRPADGRADHLLLQQYLAAGLIERISLEDAQEIFAGLVLDHCWRASASSHFHGASPRRKGTGGPMAVGGFADDASGQG